MTEISPLVLVVEDEAPVRKFLRAALGSNGFRLVEAETMKQALALMTTNNPELVILDLGLPDGDGMTFTRMVREWSKTPIIIVSARGQENDKVAALDAGADDYVTKPFGVKELLARMRVALRHARSTETADASGVIEVGPIRIDDVQRMVTVDGATVHLTPIEYKLLHILAVNAGRVLTHRQILKDVWGPAYMGHSHYVRVHMAELRKKIEQDSARPKWLVTEPAVGYRLRDGTS